MFLNIEPLRIMDLKVVIMAWYPHGDDASCFARDVPPVPWRMRLKACLHIDQGSMPGFRTYDNPSTLYKPGMAYI